MPKLKSKGSVKKRFKITKHGKAVCSKPGRGHMHATFNGEVRRNLRRRMVLNKTWSVIIGRMMER